MKSSFAVAFCALCLFTSLAVAQGSTTVAGVTFDSKVKVDGSELVLNGAGVRTKQLFKVYSAGIYLTSKKSTTADVLSLEGAKRVRIVILRDLATEALGSDFLTVLSQNTTSDEQTKIFSALNLFTRLFSTVPALKKGDVITLDWVPGKGLHCTLNNRAVGNEISDSAFYRALLKVWLGGRPADSLLKKALLGG